jgi:1,5-anhydro-D-fructose reductase (1,5-anhydro-D-mannitol-forming)
VVSTGWGLVGCGWVARDHVLPGLRAVPGAHLAAVHDRNPAAATGLAACAAPGLQKGHLPATSLREGGLPATGVAGTGPVLVAPDLRGLLAAPGVDAVYVATPTHAHVEPVAAAAAAGVPVLCEKPLAPDACGARALVAAAGDGLAGCAFDQRFHPAHRCIADLVAAGELGTVTAVRIAYSCWLPADWTPDGRPHDNWRVAPGGGAVIDLAPHGIDLVGVLLGGDDLEHLHVTTQSRVHGYPVDDGGVLAGRTAGGVLYSAHVAFNTPDALPRRRLEVVGTRAALVAVDTLGQTAGGRLTRLDASTGVATDVPFDATTSPFTAQLAAFTAAVTGAARWEFPLARDLALHDLLLTACERSP